MSGARPVLRVERDRTLQMRDGFSRLATLCVRDGKHVEGVIVVRVFVSHQPQVNDGFIMAPAVDGERGGIQAFTQRLGSSFSRCRLTGADVQIQADPLVQLLLLRVQLEYRLEKLHCGGVVLLNGRQTPLVKGDRLEIG